MSAAARPAAIAPRATRRDASRRRGRDASSRHRFFEDGRRGGGRRARARDDPRVDTERGAILTTVRRSWRLAAAGSSCAGGVAPRPADRSPAPAATGGGTFAGQGEATSGRAGFARWDRGYPRGSAPSSCPRATPTPSRRTTLRSSGGTPRLAHVPQRPRGHHRAEPAGGARWAPRPARSRHGGDEVGPQGRHRVPRDARGGIPGGRSATRIPSGGGW